MICKITVAMDMLVEVDDKFNSLATGILSEAEEMSLSIDLMDTLTEKTGIPVWTDIEPDIVGVMSIISAHNLDNELILEC